MSSNAAWGNNFEGNYSATVSQVDNSGSWNRPIVNTPQTNPASWPQLGAEHSENTSSRPSVQKPQESNRVSTMNNPASNSESDPGGTSAWGRPSTGPGWSAPSAGPAWGQRPPSNVDDGTAVWGKSTQTQQHQGNWGGPPHVAQDNELKSSSGWGGSAHAAEDSEHKSSSGWGVPSHAAQDNDQKPSSSWGSQSLVAQGNDQKPSSSWGSQSLVAQDNDQKPASGWGGQPHAEQDNDQKPSSGWVGPNLASQDGEQKSSSVWGGVEQTSTNNQEGNSTPNSQQSMPSSQASGSSQPVSWAKAAAAGLPSSSTGTETTSLENDQVVVESPTPQPAVAEADPVQKLVNSHEGWGKKPIQQGTSWNISESTSGIGRSSNNVSNGTEAWGKPSGGQMPPGPGWSDSSSNKQSAGWGSTYNHQPAKPGEQWGGATPQQQRPSFTPGNSTSATGWGNPSQQGMGNGKWNDASGQPPNNPSGWGNPPSQQNSGWGAMPPSNENNSTGWGNTTSSRPGPQGAGWGSNAMPQSSSTADPSTWGRASNARQQGTVDDGTSAWGDPGTYSKVNMWDKSKAAGGNPETAGGQLPSTNSQIEPKGWGSTQNQAPNMPPSPKGWGDISPTQNNTVDNGTSGWGQKPVAGDKWDKGNSTGNWNAPKQTGGGWVQPNESRWGSSDNGSNWSQNSGKNDLMKNAGSMDFGPRGAMLPQQSMNPQMMMRNNPTPPVPPPQLQNQFNQIRHAVTNGLLPSQVLSPQYMTPQHVHTIMQLINKTTELQKMQMKLNILNQNKAIPQMQRQQQMEQFSRALRQCQQQIEAQKTLIIQNMHQVHANKPQPNLASKMNGPAGGMDLGGVRTGPGGQSMMSPLNNMSAMSQALPTNMPLMSMPSPTAREQKSRFMNNFISKRPNFGMGDNLQQINQTNMPLGVGPGGDTHYNGLPFRPNVDDLTMPDNGGMIPNLPLSVDLSSSQPTVPNDPSIALADIGPPEFTPGVPWKGFRHIDPESDPNITPGSVANAKSMSINTVRDADEVLNRDRFAQPDSSRNFEEENVLAQLQGKAGGETSPPQIWSSGANGTVPTAAAPMSLSDNLWKGSNQNSSFQPPKELAPSWGEQHASGRSWDQQPHAAMQRDPQNVSWNGGNQDVGGCWLVLTNFNQVDPSYVRSMCNQHGSVISFKPHFPLEGMALAQFASPVEAINAKKALNMCVVGSTMLIASVATDQDVSNFMTASGGTAGSWTSNTGGGNRLMTNSGATGGFMAQPPPRLNMATPADMGGMQASRNGQQFWGNAGPSGASWAANASHNLAWSGATGEEMGRIMSPMHSLLPENLLGNETA